MWYILTVLLVAVSWQHFLWCFTPWGTQHFRQCSQFDCCTHKGSITEHEATPEKTLNANAVGLVLKPHHCHYLCSLSSFLESSVQCILNYLNSDDPHTLIVWILRLIHAWMHMLISNLDYLNTQGVSTLDTLQCASESGFRTSSKRSALMRFGASTLLNLHIME